MEWEPFDLRAPSGVTIEVKSAAAFQSWKQTAPTPLEFAIGPRRGWDREMGQFSEQVRRWADLYVFCVLEGTDTLDLDAWKFYVLATAVLDEKCGQQKSIRLGPLEQLSPRRCNYQDLSHAIEEVGSWIARDGEPGDS